VLLYRVFPYLPTATVGEPGHPLYIHPDQGQGRFDNPDPYSALYVASTPTAAIGEVFHTITHWNRDMLAFPALPGSVRHLATLMVDEERHPLLDLNDARALLERNLRPSDVTIRNRPHTQRIACAIHAERVWSGITFWSNVRPQWTAHVLWDHSNVQVAAIEELPGHPGLRDANDRLFKPPMPDDLRSDDRTSFDRR